MTDLIGELTGAQGPQDPPPKPPRVFQTTGNPFAFSDDERQAMYRSEDSAFQSQWAQAIQTEPDTHAEMLKIAANLGVEPSSFPDIRVARELDKQRQVRDLRLWKEYPVLMRMLEIPNVARFAHDDLDNLKRVESTWLEMKLAVVAGRNQAEQDLLWDRVRSKGGIWDAADTDELRRLTAEAADLPNASGFLLTPLRYFAGQNQPLFKQAFATASAFGLAGGTIGAIAAAGPQAPIGVLTAPAGTVIGAGFGFAQGMISASQRMQSGAAYREAIKRGVVHGSASNVAALVGTANAVLDFVGLKGITAPITSRIAQQAIKQAMVRPTTTGAGATFAKELLRAPVGEVATENVQEVVAMVGEAATGKQITFDEYLDRAAAVTQEAFLASFLPGTIGPVLGAVHDIRMAAEATRYAKFLTDVSDGVQSSKTTKRMPMAMRNFLSQLEQGTEATDIYVNAGVLREVLQQSEMTVEDLRKLSPSMADQLQQLEADDDVTVPMKDYVVDIASTGLGKKLMDHVRPSEDARSLEQAKQVLLKQTELFQEADEIAKEAQEEGESFGKQVAKIEADFRTQLLAAAKAEGSKIDEEQAAFLGKLHRALVVVQSKREGLSPEEWVAKRGVSVGTGEGDLQQLPTDTPEFKAWFGDSKIVDDGGKPMRVYHGTPTPGFTEFSKDRRGSKSDGPDSRLGFFFTPDPDFADEFTWDKGDRPGGIMPVYLSMKNPLQLDSLVPWTLSMAEFAKKIEEAKAAGHDGVAVFGATLSKQAPMYLVFEPTQIKSAIGNRGTFAPNDPNILKAGEPRAAKGAYNRAAKRILLNKRTDVSTVVHELSHFYLDTLMSMATEMVAPGAVDDARAVLAWFGVKDTAAWSALTAEQQEKHHETFAYNFEIWMFEGKAPSKKLEGVFKRVLQWMRAIYSDIRTTLNATYRKRFGEDLPMLTDDIRSVFDRMLASEREITLMKEIRAMEPLFQTKEQALKEGMTEEQWAEYDHWRQQDEFESVEEWMLANVRTAKWWRKTKDNLLRRLQKEADGERKKITAEVTADLLKQPVYRVRHWLQTGKWLNPEGEEVQQIGTALSEQDVKSFFERAGGIDKKAVKDAGIKTAEDGIPAQVAAEFFRYPTADDMLLDLTTAPKQKSDEFAAVVASAVEARMLIENTEIATAEGRANQVDILLHNEARMKFLATEWKFLSGSTEPVKVLAEAARQVAERQMDGSTVKKVRGRDYGDAESRAARDAKKAMRAGDREATIRAKRQHLLASQMTAAALKAREEVQEALQFFQEVRGGSDKKLAKQRDMDFVNAARAILAAYGLAGEAAPMDLLEPIRRFDPDFFEEIAPVVRKASQAAMQAGADYANLTMDEFRAMRDAVKALWFKSLRAKQVEIAGKKQSIADWKARALPLVAKAAAIPGRIKGAALMSFKSLLGRVEHWALKLDGGKAGPWTSLFREIKNRATALSHARRETLMKMRDLVMNHDFSGGAIVDGEFSFANKYELIGALQHSGNESNLVKNLVGRGWAEVDEKGNADTSAWWAFVDRQIERGVLTKKDFDFVQAVWDLNESLLPDAQRVHYAIKGYRFDVIEAKPITTKFGTYRGGYVPAKIDYKAANKPPPAAKQGLEALTEMERDGHMILPSTGSGSTISRVGNRDPLVQDVRMNMAHIDEVLRYIHLQEGVQDIAKLLRDDEVGAALQQYQTNVVSDMLIPWLQRTALQQTKKHGLNRTLDAVYNYLRRTAGTAIMFANTINAAQQLTGIANAKLYVKGGYLFSAAARVAGSPIEIVRSISSRSEYMDERLNHQIGEIMDQIDDALTPEKWGSWARAINRNAYFLQRIMQNRVDAIVWLGAYDQAMAEKTAGLDPDAADALAVQEADSAVRLSQGSTAPEDVSAAEALTPFIRLFTMFSGYFNATLNQIMGQDTIPAKGKALVLALVVPAIAGAAIQQAAWGGWDDEDDDGYGDDLAAWGYQALGRSTLSLVPGIGPAVWSLIDPMTGGDRLALSPALTSAQSLKRVVTDIYRMATDQKDALEGRDVRDLTTAISLITGIPFSAFGRPASYWLDEREGNLDEPASGAADYIRGLATGR